MITLRTTKELTGPGLGIPNLTFQAWYEAQRGAGSWQRLGQLQRTCGRSTWPGTATFSPLPVRPDVEIASITWAAEDHCFVATTDLGETLPARRIVLATGLQGSGSWSLPQVVSQSLPRHHYAHTSEEIDFPALQGRRVAVLGAGASAFDNAAVALENGAAEVRVFSRREKLVDVDAYRWAEFAGFLRHHAELPDADKWRFMRHMMQMGQLPPADALERARQHSAFSLHPGSPWDAVESTSDAVKITTPKGTFETDFVIVATGFSTDLGRRPELREFVPHIALWADRFTPPPDEAHDDLLRHPYLGPYFEFTEKSPGTAPWVGHLYNFTGGSLLSLGLSGASITGMKYALPRLVQGITRSLFLEDRNQHFASLQAYDVKEF